ncbi:hypothetical protein F4814DRAFT_223255 [Daldinia grandis]|nr:hypothetical protein F4814DRAFT_223255 [Daldinia grandis]
MVRFIQAGLDIPDPVMEQFNRGRQWVYDAIREKRIPARGFRAAVGPIGRIEDRDFAGKTEMNIDSPSFTYQVTVTLPTVRRLGRRGPLKVDQNLCEQIIEIVPSTAAVAIPLAPVDNFSDNPDPSDTHTHAVVAATAQVVSELDDDELSSEDYDEEEEPPYTIEIQDGTALKRSLTAPKGPIARLTTSALLRDALWGAGSLKRPARTPLRSVFSGRADKRPKITDFIEPGSEEE